MWARGFGFAMMCCCWGYRMLLKLFACWRLSEVRVALGRPQESHRRRVCSLSWWLRGSLELNWSCVGPRTSTAALSGRRRMCSLSTSKRVSSRGTSLWRFVSRSVLRGRCQGNGCLIAFRGYSRWVCVTSKRLTMLQWDAKRALPLWWRADVIAGKERSYGRLRGRGNGSVVAVPVTIPKPFKNGINRSRS
jgi:hypothetical protein